MVWKNIILVFSTYFLLTVVHQTHTQRALRSAYNEHCNETHRCESQAWLACHHKTSTCGCAKANEMVYEPGRNKCVSLINKVCKFGNNDEFGTEGWYERPECVEGAVCGPSGLCSCKDGYYQDVNEQICFPKKDYDEPCGNNLECDEDKFLSCVQGKCQCDLDKAIYNEADFIAARPPESRIHRFRRNFTRDAVVPAGICVGRAGTKCSRLSRPRKYCVRNSYCSETEICQCANTHFETSERLCGLGYDQPCSSLEICADRFRCSGNTPASGYKCLCPQPNYQIFDSTENSCRGLIGAPCDPHDGLTCVDRSVCIERDNYIFQCDCDDGFIDTPDGSCQLGYGAPCNYSELASNHSSSTCDESANLQCKGGKCRCEDDASVYEPAKRKCLTRVGLRCIDSEQCVTNANCVKPPNTFWGRCICNKTFAVTQLRTCALPHSWKGHAGSSVSTSVLGGSPDPAEHGLHVAVDSTTDTSGAAIDSAAVTEQGGEQSTIENLDMKENLELTTVPPP